MKRLNLTRTEGQSIAVGLGDSILAARDNPFMTITVVEVFGGKVSFRFDADPNVKIARTEIFTRKLNPVTEKSLCPKKQQRP